MKKSLFRGKREINRALFVSVCATAHGRSWETCGFQTEKSLSSSFDEFLVPACWGLLWRAERNNKKTEKKGRKRRAISCVPSFFLSLSRSRR